MCGCGYEEIVRKRKFHHQPVLFSDDDGGEGLSVCVEMDVKRTLERGSSTASLFSGDGVGEVLCVCVREREWV